jgi:hypothetical protein
MQTWLPDQESGGYDAGRARAPSNDERARHHRKQAASPARLKDGRPRLLPAAARLCLAPRVNGRIQARLVGEQRNGEICLTSITAGAILGLGSPWRDGATKVGTRSSAAPTINDNDQAGGGMTLLAAMLFCAPRGRVAPLPLPLSCLVPCCAGAVPRRTCDAKLAAGCWLLAAGCWLSVLRCVQTPVRVSLSGVMAPLVVLSWLFLALHDRGRAAGSDGRGS